MWGNDWSRSGFYEDLKYIVINEVPHWARHGHWKFWNSQFELNIQFLLRLAKYIQNGS